MSENIHNTPNTPVFDLDTFDQNSVEAANNAYDEEWTRISGLPGYIDAYTNQREEVKQGADEDISYEEQVYRHINARASIIANKIYDSQPSQSEREFLAQFVGMPAETHLTTLYESYDRRSEYYAVLHIAHENKLTLSAAREKYNQEKERYNDLVNEYEESLRDLEAYPRTGDGWTRI
jgi:hypothetical protein